MKTKLLVITLVIVGLVLSACNGKQESAATETAAAALSSAMAGIPLNANYENALAVPMQLLVGIFQLEDTDLAVTPEQAAELLPLWKAVGSLGSSQSTAREEIEALYKQIAETLTPEQLQAISKMQLTRMAMGELAQRLGMEFGQRPGAMGTISPEMRATAQAARESGQGFPFGGGEGGFVPGGGPGMGPGGEPGMGPGGGFGGEFENMTPEQRATAIAERMGQRGLNLGINLEFLDALIDLLEAKIS